MRRVVGMALCALLILPCAVPGVAPGVAYGASKGSGLSVTPLDDEFAGQSAPLYTPPGPRGRNDEQATGQANGQAAPASGAASDAPGAQPASGSASSPLTPGGDTKDSLVIAYLIDLARKQNNRPCPSGVMPPVPPALVFSDPLCGAARDVQGGAEPLAAMEKHGIRAAKWRMFSADNAPPQRVVSGLRQAHCEALFEPFTHVGAYRDSGGWRILLATLEGETAEGDPAPDAAAHTAPLEHSAGEVTSAVPPGELAPKEAEGAATISGQEARSLFMLLNGLRAKGGECFGKQLPSAPAVAFSPELQAVAEKEVQAAPGSPGSPGSPSSPDPGSKQGANASMLYKGSNVTKLTLKANNHASVALDVWMVSPSQCETLLSPMFTDAGAAYEDGHWVLMLGGKNQGVPSDK